MTVFDLSILSELGKLTREIRKDVSKIPKKDVYISEIIDYVEKRIFEKGYLPAFPCTVCVNDIAAHYTVFDDDYQLKTGDVIKIDFGISYNGFITDNAFTVEIESNKYKDLMEANFEGLNTVMDNIEKDMTMSAIGKMVYDVAKNKGFNTIQNLSGHQISINNLHCGLSIPNYENNDLRKVEENMEFAIEPFFTVGEPRVKSCGNSNILHLINYKPVRDPYAKKILQHIKENYPNLPFSKRWLIDDISQKITGKKAFEKRKVLYALKILKTHNIIYEYDALATIDGAIVSQYEDTVVFCDNKKTIITRL